MRSYSQQIGNTIFSKKTKKKNTSDQSQIKINNHQNNYK
ncbi:hypothetical protein FM109_13810 [Vibrio casei]|nr:hypothetical protein FM109_13810 [Vibrio casei]